MEYSRSDFRREARLPGLKWTGICDHCKTELTKETAQRDHCLFTFEEIFQAWKKVYGLNSMNGFLKFHHEHLKLRWLCVRCNYILGRSYQRKVVVSNERWKALATVIERYPNIRFMDDDQRWLILNTKFVWCQFIPESVTALDGSVEDWIKLHGMPFCDPYEVRRICEEHVQSIR